VAALAVPGAFGDHRVLFAVALFAVVAGFVGIYALVSKGEPEQLAAVLRMAQIVLPGAALVVLAAFLPLELQPAFWLAALITGFVGPQLGGLGGWRVHAAHFAERHGLIVIIAVGESLAAIGFGAEGARLGVGVIVAALLGLVAAASFWLAYFDFASGGIERLLAQRRGEQRVALARDAYTYAHLPMVAGIILFAFAMRATLEHVHAQLALIPAIALCWGPALYLLAFVAVRWRVARTIGRGRPTAALAFLLLLPIATAVPAIVAVALVSLIWLALHGYELIWWREERARRRRRLPGRPDPHAEPTTESLRGRVS
jgi:low temperature requirement protein LtrA